MPASLSARLHAITGWVVKSRKHTAVVGVVAISLLGTGAIGAHALQADTNPTTSTSSSAASTSRSSVPVSNAGAKNIVQVKNLMDSSVKIAGRVQLGRVPGP